MNIATSTLAMSAVSLLATGGSKPRAELEQHIATYYAIELAWAEDAVAIAIERGLVVDRNGQLSSILPAGFAVRDRNRNGDGWDGWVATNGAGAQLEVAELMSGGAS